MTSKRQYSVGGNSNYMEDSSTNSPLTKKQQLLNSISSLNLENLVAIPSDPNTPEFAKSLLEQQQLIIKQLSGLLKIASELICEKTEQTAPSAEQQNHLLVITGLPESIEKRPIDRATSDKNNVLEIFNELEVDRCLPTSIFRMGRQRLPNEKPRPIKVIMPCSAAASEAIKNKKKLSGGKFKNVIIRRSLTKEELEERASLIERCKIKRKDTGFDFIIYAGQIILRSENLLLNAHNYRSTQTPMSLKKTHNITSTKTNQKSSLSCLYYNCQSIKNKIHELDLEISQQNPDILFLTETWINSSENPLLYLKSASLFQIIIENRNQSYKSRGGGVAMLIKNGISFRHVKRKKIAGIDTIAIDVSTNRFKYYIRLVLVYRPPSISNQSTQSLIKVLQKISEGNVVIIGDFNFNKSYVNWHDFTANNSIGKEFLEFTLNFQYSNLILDSTHYKGSVLDLLLTNNSSCITSPSSSTGLSTSDHFSIKFLLNIQRPTPSIKTF
uniref:Endonuclease/exonuclease/phosphatase domain-containing protein n=1 Tax=Meloidogyne incognita TaxID=6306 RepID=A0A914MHN2_MELIC